MSERDALVESLQTAVIACNEEIAELRTRLSEARDWIPVSERMPRDGQRVLVFKAGDTPPCDFDVDKASVMYASGFIHNEGVTHWMPLPKGPK